MFDSLFPKEWTTLQRLMWLKTNALARAVYEIVTGNPVSFTAKAAPLRKLEVAFSPVQDLHGYDSPWPAGGGVNKANLAGATIYETIPTWASASVDIDAEEITITGTPTGATSQFRLIRVPNIENGLGLKAFGSNLVNSLLWDGTYRTIQVVLTGMTAGTAVNIKFKFVAYEGQTAPTAWTPYSNICPILGWDSMTVEQRGKNLNPWEGVNFTADTHPTGLWLNSGDYVFSLDTGGVFGSGNNIYIKLEDRSGNLITSGNLSGSGWSLNSTGTYYYGGGNEVTRAISFHLNTDCFFYFGFNNTKPTANGVQLEVGSTATAYAPYNGRSISIPLGQTVYSGVLDVVTGVGEGDMDSVDMGTLDWNYSNNSGMWPVWLFFAVVPNTVNGFKRLCSIYPLFEGSMGNAPDKSMVLINNKVCYIRDDSYTDAASFKTAMSGVQLVYELAEPLPIQLTPQEVESLAGDNTLWSDANQPLTVTYRSN